MSYLDDLLGPEPAAELAGRVRGVLDDVHRVNVARYRPDRDTLLQFALSTALNAQQLLAPALADLPGVEVVRNNLALQIRAGRLRFHVYKVGATERHDLKSRSLRGSATKTHKGQANDQQLELFRLGGPDGAARGGSQAELLLEEHVFGYCGNPEDGLCALWVGAPGSGQLGEPLWHLADRLWEIDPADVVRASGDLAPGPVVPDVDYEALGESHLDLQVRDDGEEGRPGEAEGSGGPCPTPPPPPAPRPPPSTAPACAWPARPGACCRRTSPPPWGSPRPR